MTNDSPGPETTEDGVSNVERPTKRKRVAIACQPCRDRKSKCDGQTPICRLCRQAGTECSYPSSMSKTDLLRQEFTSMVGGLEDRIGGIERMLSNFQQTLSAASGQGPVTPLSRTSAPITPAQPSTETEFIVAEDAFQNFAQPGPAADGTGIAPIGSREDIAFFGPCSNIALLRLVSRALAEHAASSQNYSNDRWTATSTTEVSSIRDKQDTTSSPLHTIYNVSPAGSRQTFKLPSDSRMRELLATYFRVCNTVHPYIHEGRFMETYEDVRRSNFRHVRRSWLAFLYMLFAVASISAPYESATVAMVSPESDDWFSIASDLCLKQVFSEQGITLEVAQVLMWMVVYLQSTNSSSKAWVVHGMAVRVCYQLGLHSVEASKVADPIERETRTRTWAGLVLLDCTLTMTFGRPPQIHNAWSNLERPQTYSDSAQRGVLAQDQAAVSFLNAVLKLYEIIRKAINQLYGDNCGARMSFSAENIARIYGLEGELLQWSKALAPPLAVMECHQIVPQSLPLTNSFEIVARKQRTVLTLRFLNARILVHRPLLECLLEAILSDDLDMVYLQTMRQAGANSVSFGVTCATKLIYIMHRLLTTSHQETGLQALGSWWFSLYYVFNSALAILGGLLVSCERWDCPPILSKGQRESAIEAANQALKVLDKLDKGHSTVNRCRSYLQDLMALAAPLLNDEATIPLNDSAFISDFLNGPSVSFDQENLRQLATGVDLGFMFPAADMQALGGNSFWD